jgi:hypothetical protein
MGTTPPTECREKIIMLLGVSGSVSLMGTIKTSSFLFYFFLLIGQGVLFRLLCKGYPNYFFTGYSDYCTVGCGRGDRQN